MARAAESRENRANNSQFGGFDEPPCRVESRSTDFTCDFPSMHTYGVILRGYKEFDYYQADRWLVENGTVTLIKDGAPIALFPFENLLAVVNLTSGGRLTEAQSRDTLASNRNISGRTRPGEQS